MAGTGRGGEQSAGAGLGAAQGIGAGSHLGYSDAIHTTNNLVRQANEVRARERAERLVRAALGDAEFARLKSEGADLRDEDIAALALGAEDSN